MTRLRVATYNLYLGADLALLFDVATESQLSETMLVVRDQLERTRFPERAQAIARLLAEERPDLVGLQEVTRWSVGSAPTDGSTAAEQVLVDFLPVLVDALAAAGCGYDVHAVNAGLSGALPGPGGEWLGLTAANVTLVRRGITVIDEECGTFTASLEAPTAMEGLTLPIVRSWGRVDVRLDGAPVRFVNTHLEAWDVTTRAAQRDELLARTAAGDGPVILVGDLNARPSELGMPAGWVDAWTTADGAGHTCGQAADLANAVSTLDERIDYVWVRGADVSAAHLVGHLPAHRTTPHRLWPSDHAAVVADVDL